MKPILINITKGLMIAGAITLGLFATPAQAQIEVTIYPPAAFRATARPVYYEGHAAYWYGGRWHYRDGEHWRVYQEEPRYLREYRVVRVPVRQHYEKRRHHHRRGR